MGINVDSIEYILPAGVFNDKNGEIEAYAVILNKGASIDNEPDTKDFKACSDGVEIGQCVTLWTDHNGTPLENPKRRKKRSFDTPVPNDEITFTIGDDKITYSPTDDSKYSNRK